VGAYHWDEYKDVDLNTPERGLTTAEPDQIYTDVFGNPNGCSILKVMLMTTLAAFASLM